MSKRPVFGGVIGWLASGLLALMTHAAQADAPRPAPSGKLLFLRCVSCHDLGAPTAGKIGPNLAGVVGRKAGSLAGFEYSAAMKQVDLVWDEATLDRWLTRPTDLVPATAMAFAGVPVEAERKALIAYLRAAKP